MQPLFRSFFQAGFECSTHRNRFGRRLDLLQSTGHDCYAREDYERIRRLGIRTIRTGARWHLIEQSPGHYDFRSLEATLNPAYEAGMEVLLDVFHFGWPDHIDIFSAHFPNIFAKYARALAVFLRENYPECRKLAPVITEK